MLRQMLALTERDIIIEMKRPDEWDAYLREVCRVRDRFRLLTSFNLSQLYGFPKFYSEHKDGQDKVVAFNPTTGRLVGGEQEFVAEVLNTETHSLTLGRWSRGTGSAST